MTTLVKKDYWTPVDNFILRVVEKYGSLAMLSPRIQSPYDLIKNEDITSSVRKFRFTRYLKNFYLDFLNQNSLMNPNIISLKMCDSEESVKKIDSFNQNLSDVSLMSHPPMLGHWLKESGFITPDHMKEDHEYSYKDYVAIFDGRTDINRTRKHLFPSFEGLLITRTHLAPYRNEDGEKCIYEELISTIYALDENISFNSTTGKFDNYNITKIYPYGFLSDLPEDKNRPQPTIRISSAYVTNNRPHFTPLSIFNDRTFTKLDEDKGFFNTNIAYAYHMNFDLNASYEFEYPKEDTEILVKGKRIRKYTSLDQNSRTTGRIIPDRPKAYVSDCSLKKISEINSEKSNHEHDKENNFLNQLKAMTRPEKYKEKDMKKLFNMWLKLPVFDNPEKILPARTVYSSYYDYYWHDTRLKEIMSKPMSNYFWFMYGALPTNKIYYEDLCDAFELNSVLDYEESSKSTEWTTFDMAEIFESNKGKLATEYNKEELMTKYRQGIKFLALVWGLKLEDVQSFSDIPMYYISNSGTAVSSTEIKFEVLQSIYPKIGSLNYVAPPVSAIKSEPAPRHRDDTVYAVKILLKIENTSNPTPLNKDDLDFLKSNKILDDEDEKLYEQLGNKIEGADPNTLSKLFRNIQNKKQRIENFMKRPIAEVDSLVTVPSELSVIDEDIRFSKKDMPITEKEIGIIKRIWRYLLHKEPSLSIPRYVSNDMILYLINWKIVDYNPTKAFKERNLYIRGPGPTHARYYHYLKIDGDKIPEYENFLEELRKFNGEEDASYIGKTSQEISGGDRNVTTEERDRPRGDSGKGGGGDGKGGSKGGDSKGSSKGGDGKGDGKGGGGDGKRGSGGGGDSKGGGDGKSKGGGDGKGKGGGDGKGKGGGGGKKNRRGKR